MAENEEKTAVNALDVQIVAIPGKMKIRIAVPLELFTIEQTSACMFQWSIQIMGQTTQVHT
jgi:hypothetical protein